MPACLRPVRRPKKCVRAEPQAQPTPGAPWWSGYSIEMCEFILVGEECPRRGRGCGYAHTQEERTLAEAACRRDPEARRRVREQWGKYPWHYGTIEEPVGPEEPVSAEPQLQPRTSYRTLVA